VAGGKVIGIAERDNHMGAKNDSQETSVSKAGTPEEIGEYWDDHSLAAHWNQTREVEFEMRAQRPHRIAIDQDLYERLAEQARTRGVTPETLINQWLSERLTPNKAA
jgi:CopG antitoxin of type II toxin-antitoxin system